MPWLWQYTDLYKLHKILINSGTYNNRTTVTLTLTLITTANTFVHLRINLLPKSLVFVEPVFKNGYSLLKFNCKVWTQIIFTHAFDRMGVFKQHHWVYNAMAFILTVRLR